MRKHIASACMAGLFGCVAAVPAARAATVEVYAYLGEDEGADLVLLADGKEVCAIKVTRPTREIYDRPSCRFEWPSSVKTLGVRGSYEGTHWRTHKRYRHEGEERWPVVDFAPVGSRLKTPGKSYGDRMADFVGAANAFARVQVGLDHESVDTGKPASAVEIAAAEKRLGYALPPDFVSMLRTVGALAIGDHSVMSIDDVDDADSQMVAVWGTPEEAMASSYGEKQRANLRASTLLFTEVGDGLGGLRYRPPPTRSCGDRPLFQWISQEGGDDLLLRADGACMDFDEAFRWVLDGMLLEGYADELSSEKDALLVDSSQDTMPLVLRTEPDRFGVLLVVRWQGPNGYWRAPAVAPAAAVAPEGTGL